MDVRAAVAFQAGKPLALETVRLEGPHMGDVLVEIKATGVCHTDDYTLSGRDPEGRGAECGAPSRPRRAPGLPFAPSGLPAVSLPAPSGGSPHPAGGQRWLWSCSVRCGGRLRAVGPGAARGGAATGAGSGK